MFVSVDCFGPFIVQHGRVDVKGYGVLFMCLVLRAVHNKIIKDVRAKFFQH